MIVGAGNTYEDALANVKSAIHADLIAARAPQATLAVVRGGHVALIENRDAVQRAILDWLDG